MSNLKRRAQKIVQDSDNAQDYAHPCGTYEQAAALIEAVEDECEREVILRSLMAEQAYMEVWNG